jgi:hypothetical protein
MDEAAVVEARFAEDGAITLLSFTWRGRKRRVASHGRRWAAEDGLHFLVMTHGDQVFELIFSPPTGLWRVAYSTEGPPRA